jgi:hypothetical protein
LLLRNGAACMGVCEVLAIRAVRSGRSESPSIGSFCGFNLILAQKSVRLV